MECRQCPRRSCKINPCHCPGGPTRLRLPTKRRLGEIIADEGQPVTNIPAFVAPLPAATTNGTTMHHTTNSNPYTETLGLTISPPQESIIMPYDLQNKVLRYKPLEFPEDVMEALQLPKRQILTRFQRRRIARGGMEDFCRDATTFEKACCKRTVQTFQDGVKRLAELLLPEDPEFLMNKVTNPRHAEAEILKKVVDESPRKSVQARTARAVLAAALPPNETTDIMTKYARKVAMKDWDRIRTGSVLMTPEINRTNAHQENRSKGAKRKKTCKEDWSNIDTDAVNTVWTTADPASAAQRSTESGNVTVPTPGSQLTIEQEAMLAMMRTMP